MFTFLDEKKKTLLKKLKTNESVHESLVDYRIQTVKAHTSLHNRAVSLEPAFIDRTYKTGINK